MNWRDLCVASRRRCRRRACLLAYLFSVEAAISLLRLLAATGERLRPLGGSCAQGVVLLDPRGSCAKHAPVLGGQRGSVVDVNLAERSAA